MTLSPDYLDFIELFVTWGSFFGLLFGLIIWGFTTCEKIYAWNPPKKLKTVRLILLIMLYPFLIFTDPGEIFRFKQDEN